MERKKIAVTKLLLDSLNPRFAAPIEAQAEAIKSLSESKKTLNLARDIAAFGINPAEQSIAIKDEQDHGFYVVLEGNRRLAALKLLDNPELSATEAQKKKFSKLAANAAIELPKALECVVVETRKEAEHWLELKHGGELDGAGLVSWGTVEQARFNRQRGRTDPNLPALEILDRTCAAGGIDADGLTDFPLTTLQRVLDAAHVKQILGLKTEKNRLYTNRPADEVDQVLGEVVTELARKTIRVDAVKNTAQIREYIDKKVKKHKLALTAKRGYEELAGGADPTTTAVPAKGKTKTTAPLPAGPRHTVIPRKFSTSCGDHRVQTLIKELKKLKLEMFPNAAVGLFRMLLEMTMILYHKQHNLPRNPSEPLTKWIDTVLKHLEGAQKIQAFETKAPRVLVTAQRHDPRSLDSIQAQLHNPHYAPSAHELITRWNELEPFVKAVCDNIT